MPETFDFTLGTTPLLVSLPHGGTYIPNVIASQMTEAALETPDTDWHVGLLYDFAPSLGASVISATHSRYVIDLNRDPAGAPLYSGADNTELVPLTTFDYVPIYKKGREPTEAEIEERIAQYWRPYHERLKIELAAVKRKFGHAILFDGHSIKSVVSRFHDGQIPDLNLGTAKGTTAHPELMAAAFEILQRSKYEAVIDGRFTGGHITRVNGAPGNGIHSMQLELTWKLYMDENPPFQYLPERAGELKLLLKDLLQTLINWQPPAS